MLNRKFAKGTLLIFLEVIINMGSHLNEAIIASFHGATQIANQMTNLQWLMFYPCAYVFAIWDAYRDAGGGKAPLSFLPFVLSALFATVGIIYSDVAIMGVLLGTVWMPLLFFWMGFGFGKFVQVLLERRSSE